jgi:MscS family membrane protein
MINEFLKISNQHYFGNTALQYAWFIGIIILGFLFLRFFSRTTSRLLFRFFKKFAADVNGEKFVELLVKPLELLISVSIVYWAISQLSYPFEEIIFKRKQSSLTYFDVIDKLYLFFLIFGITWTFLRIIDFVALVFSYRGSLTTSKSDDQLIPFVKELVKIVTYIIAVFVVLGLVFKINVLTLIAGLGIGGIAVALAAKDSLENLFGSFTIFIDKPFVVGDLVKIDGIEGNIEKVGFRSTQIRSVNRSIITVPNKKMIDGALENLTLRNFRRIKFSIGLSYETPATTLKKIIAEINMLIKTNTNYNEDSIAIFEEFGEFSMNIKVVYFEEMIEYNEHLLNREKINFAIAEIISKNGASFTHPTHTVIH